jgi:hypothetical protein
MDVTDAVKITAGAELPPPQLRIRDPVHSFRRTCGLLLLAAPLGVLVWNVSGSGVNAAHRIAAAQARWPPGSEIPVWIETANGPAGADGLVERALRAWTDAAGGRLRLQRSGATDAAIRVRFIRPGTVYGETLPVVDSRTGTLVGAEVAITAPAEGDALERQIIVYLTALHELGHALGLAHSDEFTDIMYRFRRADDGERYFGAYRARLRSDQDIGSPRATGLSARDIDALHALYDR